MEPHELEELQKNIITTAVSTIITSIIIEVINKTYPNESKLRKLKKEIFHETRQ